MKRTKKGLALEKKKKKKKKKTRKGSKCRGKGRKLEGSARGRREGWNQREGVGEPKEGS